MHRWYGRVFGAEVLPLASAADGVGTLPETATAVAVRLLDGDQLRVVAPCGLEDLFAVPPAAAMAASSTDRATRSMMQACDVPGGA